MRLPSQIKPRGKTYGGPYFLCFTIDTPFFVPLFPQPTLLVFSGDTAFNGVFSFASSPLHRHQLHHAFHPTLSPSPSPSTLTTPQQGSNFKQKTHQDSNLLNHKDEFGQLSTSALGVGHHSVRHIHHPRLEGVVPERVAHGDVEGERNEEEVWFVWVLCKEGDVLEQGTEEGLDWVCKIVEFGLVWFIHEDFEGLNHVLVIEECGGWEVRRRGCGRFGVGIISFMNLFNVEFPS